MDSPSSPPPPPPPPPSPHPPTHYYRWDAIIVSVRRLLCTFKLWIPTDYTRLSLMHSRGVWSMTYNLFIGATTALLYTARLLVICLQVVYLMPWEKCAVYGSSVVCSYLSATSEQVVCSRPDSSAVCECGDRDYTSTTFLYTEQNKLCNMQHH